MLLITTCWLSRRVLTSDPADIAAASADGSPNGNLLALNALRAEGGAESRWAALVAAQSQALAAARSETAAASTRRDNSFASRDEITGIDLDHEARSEEHTSELQSLMRISYAVFCLKTNNTYFPHPNPETNH